MKKLVIIDEYFVDMVGHYYEYNKSVKEIFEEKGVATVIYANARLDGAVQRELGAAPFFEGLPKNALNKIPVLGQLANRMRFWRALSAGIGRCRCSRRICRARPSGWRVRHGLRPVRARGAGGRLPPLIFISI